MVKRLALLAVLLSGLGMHASGVDEIAQQLAAKKAKELAQSLARIEELKEQLHKEKAFIATLTPRDTTKDILFVFCVVIGTVATRRGYKAFMKFRPY